MITVQYRRNSWPERQPVKGMFNEDDLADFLNLLESNNDVSEYTIVDTDLEELFPTNLGIYRLHAEAFPKFKVYKEL